MIFPRLLSAYLNLNILLLTGFAGLVLLSMILRGFGQSLGSGDELRLHYRVLAVILLLSILSPLIPVRGVFSPALKLWSAPSLKNFYRDYSEKGGVLQLAQSTAPVSTERLATTWAFAASAVFGLGIIFMVRDLRHLRRLRRGSYLLRKIGRVRIYVNDDVAVPFSYWLPGRANVVLTTSMPAGSMRMAVIHELQHHRQADTRWVYLLWGLKQICFLNPAAYLWQKWISEIQEFACDETLVDQNKVKSWAYARCLAEVAQTANGQSGIPVCATGLAGLLERKILKRRIEKMFSLNKKNIGRSIGLAASVSLGLVLTASAYAAKSLVHDRRVTMAQAQDMARKAQGTGEFPVVVNELVLKQLNRYIGTPEGREFMRESLVRMENYRAMVSSKLRRYGAPEELMAIPIAESGYQNLPERNKEGWGVGLWMFIASTARNFGLRVENHIDERLNEKLETDAGVRYLLANHLRFRDWLLGVMAYNMGERALQEAIDNVGSRDAWVLIRNGAEGDKDYLARVMAAILIMRNPQSVE